MTLIAAKRYQDGALLCADAQETVGDYRMSVQKISPETMGNFEVIVAGSGNPSLIESFIVVLRRAIVQSKYTDIEEFEALTEKTLERFYRCDVRLCQDDDKHMQLFIVAVCDSSPHNYDLWMTDNVRLQSIGPDWEMIGWEKPLYSHIVKRFNNPDMNVTQVFLAGIYLFALAGSTSNYIGGPTSIAHIWGGGITMQDAEYIESTAKRLKEYEKEINDIFLACADSTIAVHLLEQRLAEFSQGAIAMHRHHIDQIVNAMKLEDMLEQQRSLLKLPLGTIVTLHANGSMTNDGERTAAAIKCAEGKRLMYKQPS